MATLSRLQGSLRIDAFRAEEGGCLGYLLVDGATGSAMAVDPRLDQTTSFTDALRQHGSHLVYVLDTHTHADHLSGVRHLARVTGAMVLAHERSKLRTAGRRLRGGDELSLGSTPIRILDAPGHTPDSLALLVDRHLFTGDALFAGGAGRTDFPGGNASDLFDTFRRFEALPDETVVHPGHDYTDRPETTIGEERAHNPLLREHDRQALVTRLSGVRPLPGNMAAIVGHNVGDADAPVITASALAALLAHPDAPRLLDVRTAIEFESLHIDGAQNIPLEELESRVGEVPDQTAPVVVCRSGVRATPAADVLERAGRRATVLEGGMNAWRRGGLSVIYGRRRLPVDRQVQLIAGTMVLAGVALGAFVNLWFLFLPAFFGAGLTFAGATGTCGLALLLMKAPWNRSATPQSVSPAMCAATDAAAVCAATTKGEA